MLYSGGMKPLNKLGEQRMEDGSLWELWERDGELSLQHDGLPCASSFTYGSEETMAETATAPITRAAQPQIMIAGVGLGYGLAKAMDCIKREKAKFIVAEPVEAVLRWNREFSANKAVWEDSRVLPEVAHAADLCRKRTGSLHAILLRHVHSRCELNMADAQAYFNALKGGSLLAITVARRDKRLESTLMRAGFEISTTPVPASSRGKQQRMHILVLARRGRFVPFAERNK